MISTKTYKCNIKINEIQSYFYDLKKFRSMHPYIKSISENDKNGYYKVKENPFKFLPITISYWLKPIKDNNKVTYLVRGLPVLKPTLHYSFEKNNNQTKIFFTIEVKGIIGANHYLIYKMKKAMNKLVKNLNTIN